RAGAEQRQAAVGDHVAADDVGGTERDRGEGQHVLQHRVRRRGHQQSSDEDDAVDGVGARHQGRVQRGRHLGDHFEPDQQAEHEDGDDDDQIRAHDRASLASSSATARLTTAPPWVTSTPAWISSAGSMWAAPSGNRYASSAVRLRAYAADAAGAIWEGRFPAPMTVTPWGVTIVVSGTAPSTLPPSSPQATSTTTLPGSISSRASATTSSGGRRPGTCAVVITTSNRETCLASSCCSVCCSSPVSARAYPSAPSPLPARLRSRNRAPTDSASARACGRMSKAVTTAPSRRAVPMADSPATPAPSTSTVAGGEVPAAVVSIGK